MIVEIMGLKRYHFCILIQTGKSIAYVYCFFGSAKIQHVLDSFCTICLNTFHQATIQSHYKMLKSVWNVTFDLKKKKSFKNIPRSVTLPCNFFNICARSIHYHLPLCASLKSVACSPTCVKIKNHENCIEKKKIYSSVNVKYPSFVTSRISSSHT